MFRFQLRISPQDDRMMVGPLRTLVMVGAVAAILGALLTISADGLGLITGISGEGFSNDTVGLMMSVLFLAGKVLILVGLVGLYLRQSHAAGTFGVVAFVIFLAGTGLMIATDWAEVFVAPILADALPDIATNVPPRIMVGFILDFATEAVGLLLFGIATFRAGVLPRPAALLVAVGNLIPFVGLPWAFMFLYMGVVWLGIAVLRSLRPATLPVIPTVGTEVVEQV